MLATSQSFVLGIMLTIVAVISLITTLIKGAFTASYVLAFVVTVLMALLTLYDTDCLVMGNCTIWSWMRTAIYAAVPLLLVLMNAFGTFSFTLFDLTITKNRA
jgi:hypothetical protein